MVKRKKTNPLIGTKADDEADLCRKLTKIFNRKGFSFEFINTFTDLEDNINHVLIEVKYDDAKDGVFQLLYGMIRNEKKNTQFIGVCDRIWLTLWECPEYGLVADFVSDEVSNIFHSPPSSWNGKKVIEALEFLKDNAPQPNHIVNKDFKLKDLKEAETWLDKNNVIHVYQLFGKYGINMSDFIAAQGDLDVLDIEVFDNRIDVKRKDKTISVDVSDGPIDYFDKGIIQRMRIRDSDNLEDLRQKLDQFRKNRSQHGAYYTEKELSIKCGKRVIDLIDPDWVGEPMAGAGSLILPFRDNNYFVGWLNDYDIKTARVLKSEYSKYGYVVTCKDVVEMSIDEIVALVGNAKNPLFITNPPFSSSSGAAGKINYGTLGDKYGRGNQIYPTIGKIIEVMKRLKRGYLAFFSPFGIFCERKAHMKLLDQLLSNFAFIEGNIYSGKNFNDVSGNKPISFTVWKYGGKADIEKMIFECEDGEEIGFKRCLLLKDGWNYDTRKLINNEILVQHDEMFNDPHPKIFHSKHKKGGSELVKSNIRIELGVNNLPSEMVYGLWSITVGLRSITKHPLHFDNAYTHMPDFTKKEGTEILAYALLFVFIGNDYTNGKIGFVGSKKKLKFGNSKRLNDGAKYLFDIYGDLKIGNQTIKEILKNIKKDERKDNWKADIKKEISDRLDKIGYWDYIPLPKKKKTNPLIP